MRNVSIQGSSTNKVVSGVVELIISNLGHHPDDEVEPHPGTSGVEALKGVDSVKWVEEKMSHVRVDHW